MTGDKKAQYGLIASSFDILHPGYLRLFKQVKEYCETLVVFLHVDPSVERPEKNKPILSLEERIFALESNRYVDKIIPYDTEEDLLEHLKAYAGSDSVRFLGDDYKNASSYTGKELGLPIVWISREHGWSLTKLRELIIQANQAPAKEKLLQLMKKISLEHKQQEWYPDLDFTLYDQLAVDPVFDQQNNVILLSNYEKEALLKLHGQANGWWAKTKNGELTFLSMGEWLLYYVLNTASVEE
jgi:glycerol-3-phosphate cytidylyltransferase